MKVRRVHKALALGFWAWSILTMTSGLLTFISFHPDTSEYKPLCYVNMALMLGITISFELYYQWMWR